MRGEHTTTCRIITLYDGSSPRARGTQGLSNPDIAGARIIPACAGNTTSPTYSRRTSRDHPRVRGEHCVPNRSSVPASGSSPRARGTRARQHRTRADGRIIPACAGNTTPAFSAAAKVSGSSPRARGTRVVRETARAVLRIIPACAGNTASRFPRSYLRADHPRVRGEHSMTDPELVRAAGSSPRARGTQHRFGRCAARVRIIPACAGNTSSTAGARGSRSDHPRVRGEHETRAIDAQLRLGSSPRARGTQESTPPSHPHSRIIPACAGNTAPVCPMFFASPDHPRVRGEHCWHQWGSASGGGSSPRARGTHLLPSKGGGAYRIIPACAGNTP